MVNISENNAADLERVMIWKRGIWYFVKYKYIIYGTDRKWEYREPYQRQDVP